MQQHIKGCLEEKLLKEGREELKWPLEIFGQPDWYLKDINQRKSFLLELMKIVDKDSIDSLGKESAEDKVMIDFGSGEGTTGVALAQIFEEKVICIDIDADHLEWGIRLRKEKGTLPEKASVCYVQGTFPNLEWVQFKSYPKTSIKLAPNSVSFFISYLGCMANQIPKICRELKYILKADSLAVFVVPNFWIDQKLYEKHEKENLVEVVMPPRELKIILKKMGWKIQILPGFWTHQENDPRFSLKYWGSRISGFSKEKFQQLKSFSNSLGVIVLKK